MAKKTPTPETAAEQPAAPAPMRMIAQLDKDYVLVGRVTDPSDRDWEAAAEETRFPNGFDNALNRYRLVNWAPDKWRFEPIHHVKDEPKENAELLLPIVAPLVRVVMAQAKNLPTRQDDLDALATFLSTFDGAL